MQTKNEQMANWITNNSDDLFDHMLPDEPDAWGPFLRALANDFANAVQFPLSREHCLLEAAEAILRQLESKAERYIDDQDNDQAWWSEQDRDADFAMRFNP
jgi:hypothetical protein